MPYDVSNYVTCILTYLQAENKHFIKSEKDASLISSKNNYKKDYKEWV